MERKIEPRQEATQIIQQYSACVLSPIFARKVAQEAIKECQMPAPSSQKDAIVNS